MHIDLPPFILVHALGLVALGFKLLFFDRPEKAALGLAATAIGACYLATAYVPQESNVFLHASGPVRMLLGSLAATKLLLSPSMRRSVESKALLGLMLYDGLGGLHLCWWLSNFTGLAPKA